TVFRFAMNSRRIERRWGKWRSRMSMRECIWCGGVITDIETIVWLHSLVFSAHTSPYQLETRTPAHKRVICNHLVLREAVLGGISKKAKSDWQASLASRPPLQRSRPAEFFVR